MTLDELDVIYRQLMRDHVGRKLNPHHIDQLKVCGFVSWDSNPPNGVAWWRHKHSFLEAIYLALTFTETDCINEWIIVDRKVLPLIRTLFRFKDCEPECGHDTVRIGKLRRIDVFLRQGLKDSLGYSFVVGHNDKVATGVVFNGPWLAEGLAIQ